MKGYDEIRGHFQKEQCVLKSMKHDIQYISVLPERIYFENDTTYI